MNANANANPNPAPETPAHPAERTFIVRTLTGGKEHQVAVSLPYDGSYSAFRRLCAEARRKLDEELGWGKWAVGRVYGPEGYLGRFSRWD